MVDLVEQVLRDSHDNNFESHNLGEDEANDEED